MDTLNATLFLIGAASLFGATYFLYQSVQIRKEAKEQIELGLQIHEDTVEIQNEIARLKSIHPTCPAVAVSDWKNLMNALESAQDFEKLSVLRDAIKGKGDDEFIPPPQGFWTFFDNKGQVLIQII